MSRLRCLLLSCAVIVLPHSASGQAAVDDPGEGGEPAVYDLGEFGTIQSMKWLSRQSDETAILQLSVLNFPVHVFSNWPGLKRVQRTFLLTIGPDSVVVQAKR
jgi:hypothetical protein